MNLVATSLYGLLVVLAVVAADWLLGVLAAFRLGSFNVHKLPDQLTHQVLPVMGALLVVWIIQYLVNAYQGDSNAFASASSIFSLFAYATVLPRLLADVAAKLTVIGAGSGSSNAVPSPAPPPGTSQG